ncbi:MAG: hypothetical protein IJV00_07855, partial [Clostridia bacterium]|nr:hypothetical protein [Clostridia bacterium]
MKKIKRILSVLLIICMLLSAFPVATAEKNEEPREINSGDFSVPDILFGLEEFDGASIKGRAYDDEEGLND